MTNNYGKKYAGSGAASIRPRTGGADWYPLPDDTFYEAPITEVVIDEYRPGFFG